MRVRSLVGLALRLSLRTLAREHARLLSEHRVIEEHTGDRGGARQRRRLRRAQACERLAARLRRESSQ